MKAISNLSCRRCGKAARGRMKGELFDLQNEMRFDCIDHRAFLPVNKADPQGFRNGVLTCCCISLPLALLVKSHWLSMDCGSGSLVSPLGKRSPVEDLSNIPAFLYIGFRGEESLIDWQQQQCALCLLEAVNHRRWGCLTGFSGVEGSD